MKGFIDELAEHLLNEQSEGLNNTAIVFANRRAGVFFRKSLSKLISKPIWAPHLMSIADFLKQQSKYTEPDRLQLIYRLYTNIRKLHPGSEDFEHFFFWGDILLKDFDELDRFMCPPKQLFSNLADLKSFDDLSEALSEDQVEVIKRFWRNFEGGISKHQKEYLKIWDILLPLYQQFTTELLAEGLAYEGLVHRKLAEDTDTWIPKIGYKKIIFAGFNALTFAEERIITALIKAGKAEVYWDADDHYLQSGYQEAGTYLRQYRNPKHALAATFKKSYSNRFQQGDKAINVISAGQSTSQAQALGNLLLQNKIPLDERTAILLPDEQLLFPVLHMMPEHQQALNITMGYPPQGSLIHSLVDFVVSLQLHIDGQKKPRFNHRHVKAILRHPLMGFIEESVRLDIIQTIQKANMIFLSWDKFAGRNDFLDGLFVKVNDARGLIQYLLTMVSHIGHEAECGNIQLELQEKEFIYRYYELINRLYTFISTSGIQVQMTAIRKLIAQFIKSERIPFEGEPLEGLQVMGLLESRSLDFENIIILSANEGSLPPEGRNISFVPANIRRAFGLPTKEHNDSLYAYLFYRAIQRASNIFIIYNTVDGFGASSEVSRYIRQLEQETNANVSYLSFSPSPRISPVKPVVVEKNSAVMKALLAYTATSGTSAHMFSPSAFNTYFDCSLKFYFRHILHLQEGPEVEDDMDARMLGNIFHHVMEKVYKPFETSQEQVTTESLHADKIGLNKIIDEEIKLSLGMEASEDIRIQGQAVLIKEMVKKTALKVLDHDKRLTPFQIFGLERGVNDGYFIKIPIILGGKETHVFIRGYIDRIDKTQEGYRIIDYKTGKDESQYGEISSLFDAEKKERNKAVFQLFMYALMFDNTHHGDYTHLQAGLYNNKEVFKENFNVLISQKLDGKEVVMTNIVDQMVPFKEYLSDLIEEIFDADQPFVQTETLKKCNHCEFIGICGR